MLFQQPFKKILQIIQFNLALLLSFSGLYLIASQNFNSGFESGYLGKKILFTLIWKAASFTYHLFLFNKSFQFVRQDIVLFIQLLNYHSQFLHLGKFCIELSVLLSQLEN